MRYFYDLFPDVANKEMLSIEIKNEIEPDGIYMFFEHYCDNLSCRCAIVALDVLFIDSNDESKKSKHIASINYSWEEPISQTNPSLHSDSITSDMTPNALTMFRRIMKNNTDYPKIINNHFELVRNYVREEEKKIPRCNENPLKYGRNDPCFCGSGKKYKKCCFNQAIISL